MTRLFALALGVTLTACATTETHRVMVGPGAPRFSGPVAVVLDGAPLPGEFEEVAIVQAIGKNGHDDLEHVVEGLRREAAALGCDAVIRVKVDQGSSLASATGVAVRTRLIGREEQVRR
jgi:hypothetical protein